MADCSKRITEEFYQAKIKPRITERDKRILKFIKAQKLVTSDQIYQVFYRKNKSKRTCNDRLKVLENDLYCIKRFYPKTLPGEGKSVAHIVLNKAGYRVLGIDYGYRYKQLPISYNHYVAVNEFCIYAYKKGWGWGKLEYKLNTVKADIYYPLTRIAVEIDMGTESHKLVKNKAKKYNQINNIQGIIFVSNNQARADKFINRIHSIKKTAATTFDDYKNDVDLITNRLY